jgi:DNA-binding CsgD family transcriptional regulator
LSEPDRHDLQDIARSVLRAFEWLGYAGLLLGIEGEILGANTRAQVLLGEGSSIFDTPGGGTPKDMNQRLRHLIEAALVANPTSGSASIMLPRKHGRPVIACAYTLGGKQARSEGDVSAILMLIDPDETRGPATHVLRDGFGLTGSEVALALGLFRGQTLKEIAQVRNTSIATIRVQLRSLFAKTSTRRQAELVALLARIPPSP